ncbi:MAG: heat-inducible transcription repressor HrcA [FCB group bacterium]|nr:heat-inducible transcription repressor HrcA [FCB group bacterium]
MDKKIILTDREKQLLKKTVEEFISSIQPVGSIHLKQRYSIPLSSASIRQILFRLEQKGLLTHPYTSAGRIPTDEGYRYYVDNCLEDHPKNILPPEVVEELTHLSVDINNVLQATAQLLGKLSQLFGMVVIPDPDQSVLRDIELISLTDERIMMVLAMESGMVKSIVLNLDVRVNPKDLEKIRIMLNERLSGVTLAEIISSIDSRLKETEVFNHEIVQIILNHTEEYFHFSTDMLIYSSSLQPLLSHPEFQDQTMLNDTITALDEGKLEPVINRSLNTPDIFWSIGSENEDQLLHRCAVITAPFSSGVITGQLAILGPTRLSYKKVKQLLDSFVEIMPDVC